nr:PREDICTED: leucine-rich repeat-containing protein 16A-like [Latimeria chalumnae]|eukprot:XP_014339326.1 PREDICTED: leucine-rich repeat-containing protein 16A-like [Latimeria chalumnae]
MTEENSDIPKELVDSIRDAIGRKIKLAVKKKVKLEIKSDKVENKVLRMKRYRQIPGSCAGITRASDVQTDCIQFMVKLLITHRH